MATTAQPQTKEISTVGALWVLIQSQTKSVRRALAQRLVAEQDKTRIQQKMVKNSLTKAFDDYIRQI